MSKKLSILHGMTEVAGQNSYAVQGLREIGEKAESVVFYRNNFGYKNDRCLNVEKSKLYLLPWYGIKLSFFLAEALFKYNIFHFHFGRSIMDNLDLWVYDLFGKKYFYEFHGSDMRIYEEYCKKSRRVFTPDLATDPRMLRRNKYVCRKALQIILHDDELIPYLPEGHAPVQVVPLRMNPRLFTTHYPKASNEGKIRIVHAPTDRAGKGSEFIFKAVDRLKEKYDNLEFVLVENKTQDEARKLYESADIVVDQIILGTYGVFAVEAMSMGKPDITFISDEMKERLPEDLPIVSADIDTIYDALEKLILNPQLRNELGRKGRQYVEDYHDYRKIAYVLKDIYEGSAAPATGREAFARVKNVKLKVD